MAQLPGSGQLEAEGGHHDGCPPHPSHSFGGPGHHRTERQLKPPSIFRYSDIASGTR